jgi:branched-chain amino acid transport system permease protein
MSLIIGVPGSRNPAKTVLFLVALAVGLVAPALVNSFFMSMLLLALIYGLFAMSINLMGYTGLLSLGHAGIFATSAYGAAYVVTYNHGSYLQQILVGMVAAVIMSALFGLMAMRSGVYFLMVTLAQGLIIYGLANSLIKFGADSGLTGISRPGWLHDNTHFYYLCLAVLLVCAFLMWIVVESPFGLAMRGLNASPTRLQQLGYNTILHNFYTFMLSGFFAGIAGLLFVYDNEFISPPAAAFDTSANAVLMVIIGGIGTMSGPLIGAFTIVGMQNWLSVYVERWPTIEGLVFIGVVLFARHGFVGAVSQAWHKALGHRRAPVHDPLLAPATMAMSPNAPAEESARSTAGLTTENATQERNEL